VRAQAVTRNLLAVGQELTFAKERVALLDEEPRPNGNPSPPQPVGCAFLIGIMLGVSQSLCLGCSGCPWHASPSGMRQPSCGTQAGD
jgi:hypothetical protein